MPVIVTNNFPPAKGGIQTMLFELAEALHGQGEKLAVVANTHPEAAVFDRTLPYPIIRYQAQKRPFEVFALMQAYLKARRLVPDDVTLLSGWWPAGVAVTALPHTLRRRCFVITYGMEIDPERGGWRGRLLRTVYERSRGSIVISRFTEGLLREAGVDRPSVLLRPGVRSSAIQPARAETPTILSVGRLVKRKGFDRMLDALALLRKAIPAIRYEIIGDGPERQTLERQAHALGLEDIVHFLGGVSDDELRAAYARAWCFSLPTRRIGGDVEGFGIVYLEAAMAELPTIGGKDSGASDAIADGETGILVDGNDDQAIADALRLLLSNRELSQSMGRRGRQRATQELTWPQAAQTLTDFLQTCA